MVVQLEGDPESILQVSNPSSRHADGEQARREGQEGGRISGREDMKKAEERQGDGSDYKTYLCDPHSILQKDQLDILTYLNAFPFSLSNLGLLLGSP